MHDLKLLRDAPDAFDRALARRGLPAQSAEILALDAQKRALQTEMQMLQMQRNQLAKTIGQAKARGKEAGEEAGEARVQAQKINARLAELDSAANAPDALETRLASLPNLPADDVPDGKDEQENVVLRTHGEKSIFAFAPKEHFALGEALGLMDFDAASRLSGARFVVLKGELSRLQRSLAAFMLNLHTLEFGYTEIAPPLLVRDAALYGTGQLPKFGDDLFKTNSGHWLIPTAEVPLTNLVADQILEEAQLPLRYTSYTPCFRLEAGAAGKDTRGMIRQHQFGKVELVSITTPEQAAEEHARMTACAEEVLKRLNLPYRVLALCTGDMGFSARKTYDLEVWLPGQDAYREISSCSDCGDFQARRMKARFRGKTDKQTRFVHTLNGSGLAVGRTLVAILEHYQQADGSIRIPEALQIYMKTDRIRPA